MAAVDGRPDPWRVRCDRDSYRVHPEIRRSSGPVPEGVLPELYPRGVRGGVLHPGRAAAGEDGPDGNCFQAGRGDPFPILFRAEFAAGQTEGSAWQVPEGFDNAE